nr:hypothetical protein [uncultured Desulfobacter sp.]
MIIRMAIGFMAGVLIVVGLFWMLQHKRIEDKNRAADAMNPEITLNESPEIKASAEPGPPLDENKADTTTVSKHPMEETLEQETQENQTAMFPVQSEPSVPDPEIAQKDETEAYAGDSKTADQVLPEEPSGNTESDLLPETGDLKKHFFWKPFSLESKAEKFAGYISDKSGVDCRVEKTGMAKYQVYYLYGDATDQAAKTALITNTGLKL